MKHLNLTYLPLDGGSLNDEDFFYFLMMTLLALAQIPISTFSHIWVLVRQYGIMFVIIVIVIIIIIIIQKSKSINTEAYLIAH